MVKDKRIKGIITMPKRFWNAIDNKIDSVLISSRGDAVISLILELSKVTPDNIRFEMPVADANPKQVQPPDTQCAPAPDLSGKLVLSDETVTKLSELFHMDKQKINSRHIDSIIAENEGKDKLIKRLKEEAKQANQKSPYL